VIELIGPPPTVVEADALRDDGYVVLEGVLSREAATELADAFDQLLATEGPRAGEEFRHLVPVRERAAADHLADLARKDPRFLACVQAPRVLGVVRTLLGDVAAVHAVNARAPRVGLGLQELHTHLGLCNTIWLLDETTQENGPTRVVPGSHRWSDAEDRDLTAPYPGERLVTGAPGTVIVLDPAILHGGTANRSGCPRRAVTVAYSRPDLAPQYP
jgi:ectoine hydroxylase-related dioxygenase (phytanoyl-CoA dioxygenase family)